jgi:hypothetical protein
VRRSDLLAADISNKVAYPLDSIRSVMALPVKKFVGA